MDISATLSELERLSSSPSTSASGPLNTLLEQHFAHARKRLSDGEDPKTVIQDLQKNITKAKKEVEKGLKGWYAALGNVGKAVEKTFPPNLAAISDAYSDPPLFSEGEAPRSLDKVVLSALGRKGAWEAVEAFEEETGLSYDAEKGQASEELYGITDALGRGDMAPAIDWCQANSAYLSSPPHPSALPYYLHRHVFLHMESDKAAIEYASRHLMMYIPTQPVLQLITSRIYPANNKPDAAAVSIEGGHTNGSIAATNGSARERSASDMDIDMDGGKDALRRGQKSPYSHEAIPLANMFRAEFCRRHGWPKEEPLEVVVDLGSRGGALNAIEKARKVMGERLGSVRHWQDLPMEIPLPTSRRYHSVFVCPVSKEQTSEDNPPKLLHCGHVIATESFRKMLKGGRRSAKCPYCPVETNFENAPKLLF